MMKQNRPEEKMTHQQLVDCMGIEREISKIEKDIMREEAKANATTVTLTNQPHTPGKSDKVGNGASKLADLRRELKLRQEERDRRNAYISSIPSSILRTAFKLRYVDGRSWIYIGRIVGYDESGIRRKVKKYLDKKSELAEKSESPIIK